MKKKFLFFICCFFLFFCLSTYTVFASSGDPSPTPNPTPIPDSLFVPETVFSDGVYFLRSDSIVQSSSYVILTDTYLRIPASDSSLKSFFDDYISSDDDIYIFSINSSEDVSYFIITDESEAAATDSLDYPVSSVPNLPFHDFWSRTQISSVYVYVDSDVALPSVAGSFLGGLFHNIGNLLYSCLDNWALMLFLLVIPIAGIVVGLIFRVIKRR